MAGTRLTALAVAAPSPFAAGRARLAASGLTVHVAPIQADETPFAIDLLCSQTRPRRTAYREWRDFQEPSARRVVATHRVLVAHADYQGGRVVLGLLMSTHAGAVRMLYVKLAHRGNGIGMLMLESAGVDVPVPVVEAAPGWKRWAQYHGLPWRVAG